jgi:hypothetical protein
MMRRYAGALAGRLLAGRATGAELARAAAPLARALPEACGPTGARGAMAAPAPRLTRRRHAARGSALGW